MCVGPLKPKAPKAPTLPTLPPPAPSPPTLADAAQARTGQAGRNRRAGGFTRTASVLSSSQGLGSIFTATTRNKSLLGV